MSNAGSPRSASPSTPSSSANEILTPRRKVAALLAQFSDSDSQRDSPTTARAPLRFVAKGNSTSELDEDSGEDEVLPRSRLAARLGGLTSRANTSGQDSTTADGPGGNEEAPTQPEAASDHKSDAEEVDAPVVRRRLLTKRRSVSVEQESTPKQVARSDSPLFFSSPGSANGSPHKTASTTTPTVKPGRSKFLAFVEKHRRERLAKEAIQIAKQAAGDGSSDEDVPKRTLQRASSPAEVSAEEENSSDDAAAKRISKQARPTRKASKKAIEEMNRETQRMNRNMQLAHQAQTRKKVTKESLLARFNFALDVSTHQSPTANKITDASSASASASPSDVESAVEHSTPLTSPIRQPEVHSPSEGKMYGVLDSSTREMHGGLDLHDAFPDVSDVQAQKRADKGQEMINEYIKANVTVLSPEAKQNPVASKERLRSAVEVRQMHPRLAKTFAPAAYDQDSDSDIEIIKDTGSKRKYAAFETLPKRKAKEMPSHLALRSLAHILGNSDKKRSMNAAEMEISLRNKARLQALQERKQKIEELKARGIIVQTAEERERDQQEVEDLVERARQEAVEIQKREKELAKKDGTYVKDALDDDEDDSEDEDFEADGEAEDEMSGSEEDAEEIEEADSNAIVNDEAEEGNSEDESSGESDGETSADETRATENVVPRTARRLVVLSDDEEASTDGGEKKDKRSPELPAPAKTPQSILRSAKKDIPGLQMSDDLPMGLSQAFAATMADSQSQDFAYTQGQDSLDLTAGLPTPDLAPVAALQRFDSFDIISDSQPASQTQPLNVSLFSQSQAIPESPAKGLGISTTQFTPSQKAFDLTQDAGYMLSPFAGSRFAETPRAGRPHSTVETVALPNSVENSPILQRKRRLQRGRLEGEEDEEADAAELDRPETAFQKMQRAVKQKQTEVPWDKTKSNARGHFDEAAEESEDEYAGLGGASDDEEGEENEADRRMIDEDTQIGKGDEAKLAGLYADRERERDEQQVSKLLKDITTGALRRKRGVGDDLDLSDEEDEAARRREAKRREFAKMRRELLKDEAVGKIADDKKKEAFLRSIEDHEAADDEDDDFDQPETQDLGSQDASQAQNGASEERNTQVELKAGPKSQRPLLASDDSQLNRTASGLRRTNASLKRKPATLAEIRESVSFLIEEPDSQAALVDLGLSDSEEDPEAYVNLDRHIQDAENDENAFDDDNEDLGDFIVDDERQANKEIPFSVFKKPDVPQAERAPFSERRTKANVVDRLNLARQSSSGAGSNASTKMAFVAARSATGSFSGVPTLLRRATTNSSLGSVSGRTEISATGVVTNKTERGNAGDEKEFIRRGSGSRRNAVNFQARSTLKEEKMSQRAGIQKASAKSKKSGTTGFLGGLFRGDSWE